MPDTRIKIGLSEETLALVDQQRGLVPRERWLRDIIETHLARPTVTAPWVLGEDVAKHQVRAPEPAPSKPPPPIPHREPIDEHREFLEGGTAAQDRAVAHNKRVKEQPVKKTKGCQHLNQKLKFGRPLCTDCGEWVVP